MTVAEALPVTLRFARLRAGLSQKELSRMLGWDRPLLSRYELGRRAPSLDRLTQFGEALDIPAWKLLRHAQRIAKAAS